ncbi:MAG: caspase family protein [Pseudomonadota bacterium]
MRSVARDAGFSLKLLLLAGFLAFISFSVPAAEQRVALVIGNNAYPAAPLKNPVNDARAMAKSLNKLGFEVILRTNLDQKGMVEVLREFGARLREGGVALFYYSGHGMQVKGRNYLIPVNSDIRSEDEVPYMSIDMAQVLDKIEAARSRANLVILDACRNNPFVRTFRSNRVGLAQMDAPGGTLLAFATAPGSVARDGNEDNGVYTKHLLAQMNTPRLPVEVMFRRVREGVTAETNNSQTPWESSSLTGDFYFNQSAAAPERAPPAAVATPRPQQAAPAVSVDPLAVELAFWNSIKDSTNPADFSAYLQQYPSGSFAGLARNRIDSANSRQARATATPEPTPSPPPVTKGLNVASLAPDTAIVRSTSRAPLAGESWTYRLVDERHERLLATVTHEVATVTGNTISEAITIKEQPRWRSQEDTPLEMLLFEQRLADGLILQQFTPFLGVHAELAVGANWKDIAGLSSMSSFDAWQSSAKIVAREKITLPAGEFNAFRMEFEASRRAPTNYRDLSTVTRISLVAWYVPETKRVVKTVRKTYNQRGGTLDTDRYELLSYKLR